MKMFKKILFFAYFGVFCIISFAAENPTVQNPNVSGVGARGTVPITSYKRGLTRTPNPIDNTGNLIVTGHIGGGKHFRGIVPYNAISDFGGSVETSDIDAFLRRSSGTELYGNYTGRLTPYYSQTGTVTSQRYGTNHVIDRPDYSYKSGYVNSLRLDSTKFQTQIDSQTAERNLRYRPLEYKPQDLERLVSTEITELLKTKEKKELQKKAEIPDPLRIKLNEDEDQTNRRITDESAQDTLTDEQNDEKPKSVYESLKMEKPETDVYGQMKKELADLQNQYQSLLVNEQIKPEEKAADQEQPEQSLSDKILEINRATAKREAILGEHKTLAGYMDDKFNKHMQAAEQLLKEGKYYKAADAYSLAAIYQPENPLPIAGKSYALFAAGEYMSSAFFLSKTLETFPEYAFFRIDLAEIIGDRDRLENQLADIQKTLQYDRGELRFLLAYIYLQENRLEPAEALINQASEMMPDSKAVNILKEAIETKAGVSSK